MGSKSRKRSKGHAPNRNQSQISEYRSFLRDPQNQPSDTIDVSNDSLEGSDSLHHSEQEREQDDRVIDYIPMPFYKRAWKWLKNNGIITVIITVLISFGAWTVRSIHSNHVIIEKLSVRIEYIEKKVDQITENSVESALIDAELDTIKTELSTSWRLDLKEIENRLNLVELQIEILDSK